MDGLRGHARARGRRARRRVHHRHRRARSPAPRALRGDEGRRGARQRRPLRRRDRPCRPARAGRPTSREVLPLVEQYELGGRRLNLLARGRVVNLAAAEGHPAAVMDMSLRDPGAGGRAPRRARRRARARRARRPAADRHEVARSSSPRSASNRRAAPRSRGVTCARSVACRLDDPDPGPRRRARHPPAPAHVRDPQADGAGPRPPGDGATSSTCCAARASSGSSPTCTTSRTRSATTSATASSTATSRSCSAPPAACASAADFFGDSTFLVISGDALTDIDLARFLARHREAGGIATLAVKRVQDTREYGVVLHDADGRITGFQEKPDPAEALSDLGNCGIYLFEPRDLRLLPDRRSVDWANDVFPALLAARRPVPRPRDRRVLERRRLARRAAGRARSTRSTAS